MPRVAERVAQRLPPRSLFSGMMDFVEHHERGHARERGEVRGAAATCW